MYKKIDLSTWERADVFNYFIKQDRCVMSITCDVDVTDFVAFCKERGLNFYAALVCLVTQVVNRSEHFRLGYDEQGELVVWDQVNPYYTDFLKDTKTFITIITPHSSDFQQFYENVQRDRRHSIENRILRAEITMSNIFGISSVPWISYSSVSFENYDQSTSLTPVITWGKYALKEGRLKLPLSLQMHHAACDGYDMAMFFLDVEHELKEFVEKQ